jgi:hypothetical protein
MFTTYVWQSSHPVANQICSKETFHVVLLHRSASKSHQTPQSHYMTRLLVLPGWIISGCKARLCSTPRTCAKPGFYAPIFLTGTSGNCIAN